MGPLSAGGSASPKNTSPRTSPSGHVRPPRAAVPSYPATIDDLLRQRQARAKSCRAYLNDVQGVGQMMQDNLVKLLQNAVVLDDDHGTIITPRLAPLAALPGAPSGLHRAHPPRRTNPQGMKRRAQARMAEMTGILDGDLSVSGALGAQDFGTEKLETSASRPKPTS